MRYRAVVIGVSAGALEALRTILGQLPPDFDLPVLVAAHRHPDSDDYLERTLDTGCAIKVKQAIDKESIQSRAVYFAPPDYHLLVEDDQTLSLTMDEPVNFARPSIDVLFESAADVYGPALVGLILTGANADGSRGLEKIKHRGGQALVQSPETAAFREMPRAALERIKADAILPLAEIGLTLRALAATPAEGESGPNYLSAETRQGRKIARSSP